MKRHLFTYASILAILLTLLFIFVFAVLIVRFQYSNQFAISEQAGFLGDFFGGIIGTFVAFANLIVFIWLSIYLYKLNETHNLKALNSNRQIVQIQLRHQELIYFITHSDLILENLENNFIDSKIIETSLKLSRIYNRLTFSFPELNEEDNYYRKMKNGLMNAHEMISTSDFSIAWTHYLEVENEYHELIKYLTKLTLNFNPIEE